MPTRAGKTGRTKRAGTTALVLIGPSTAAPALVEPVPVVTAERIAQRAFELFEARGREHGRDLDDWLRAERELRQFASVVSSTQ